MTRGWRGADGLKSYVMSAAIGEGANMASQCRLQGNQGVRGLLSKRTKDRTPGYGCQVEKLCKAQVNPHHPKEYVIRSTDHVCRDRTRLINTYIIHDTRKDSTLTTTVSVLMSLASSIHAWQRRRRMRRGERRREGGGGEAEGSGGDGGG